MISDFAMADPGLIKFVMALMGLPLIIIKECDGETSPTTHYHNHYKDSNQTCFHEANHNGPHHTI
jgi:hypothetical protein